MKTPLALVGLALLALSATTPAAPQRDEAKASRYLYCAGLNSYRSSMLKASKSDSAEVASRQNASDSFWEATVLVSDQDYAGAHKPEVVTHVQSVVADANKGNASQLTTDDKACAKAFHDEVMPLLKVENIIPEGRFDSTVPVLHIPEVKRDVVEWHAHKHPECAYQKLTDAVVAKRDKDAVTEHWTIQACDGKRFTYRVYVMRQEGGLSDAVGDVEAPADAPQKPAEAPHKP